MRVYVLISANQALINAKLTPLRCTFPLLVQINYLGTVPQVWICLCATLGQVSRDGQVRQVWALMHAMMCNHFKYV